MNRNCITMSLRADSEAISRKIIVENEIATASNGGLAKTEKKITANRFPITAFGNDRIVNICIVFLCFILFVQDVYSQKTLPERILNLEESISCALNNSKEVLIARKDIELAKEREKEADSSRYPKIDLTFNYSNLYSDRFMSLSPAFNSILLPNTGNTRTDYYITRFSLWQYVYAGGIYTSNLRLARSYLVRAESLEKAVKNNVDYEVKQAFYELAFTEKKIEIYESTISSIEDLLNKPGSVNNSDNHNLKILIQTFKNELILLKNKDQQLRLDFLNKTGLELNTNFAIKADLEPIIETYDLNKLLAFAFEYRPEPRQIQIQEEIDSLSVKLSLATRYPTVSLGANYEIPGTEFRSGIENWNATINMNIPIFDGWASPARIRQKKLQLEQNKLKKKDIEDSIRLDVRKSITEYNFWLTELADRKTQFDTAKKSYLGQNEQDKVYLYNFYLQCRINYVDAVYKNLISHASIEHSIGKSLTEK